jgi:hypothetical protein
MKEELVIKTQHIIIRIVLTTEVFLYEANSSELRNSGKKKPVIKRVFLL